MPAVPATERDESLGALLLARARAAIGRALGRAVELPDDPALAVRGATLVALSVDGKLRGRAGGARPVRALRDDVAANAVAAALHAPDSVPLAAAELDALRIEVALLSEIEFLDFADDAALLAQLTPFEHGLMLFGGCRGASFLPGDWRHFPDPGRFLAALKARAGVAAERPAGALMAARYRVRTWSESMHVQPREYAGADPRA
ncbi:AmmeMemoRadiSam system protein A [Pseudothauera nasutitermitis]|uniref:AmmeMemoRadiSam system protein A n=1 Tax=Pseudothauera nasutitermitis TaxID=2565930 RepID=A0A4S4B0S8_9RHOO|nr:AmmeMemoRadiSam system protein A [Pseudothauera nasutitermitis]THF66146.1 AmmeMemoRadiSam system protein A [Pseudothauera nasutitermitis]